MPKRRVSEENIFL